MQWKPTTKRDMPWTKTKDPYKIWLSEIILQQTRVDQGRDYYLKFVRVFPAVKELAAGTEDQVMALWKGLGYYSRARNIHYSAKLIVDKFDGRFPNNYKDILSLKGVGPYTAAAISSFAFGLPHAVVDGNVYRVLARFFEIDTPIDSTEGKKLFQKIADECIDQSAPAQYNQRILDFGATLCTPTKPACANCPLSKHCKAYQNDTVGKLPIKSKKLTRKRRFFHYFWSGEGSIYIRKRTENDIWKKLYELPMIESSEPIDPSKAASIFSQVFSITLDKKVKLVKTAKQMLTHQEINACFYQCVFTEVDSSIIQIDLSETADYGFPKIVDDFINELKKGIPKTLF